MKVKCWLVGVVVLFVVGILVSSSYAKEEGLLLYLSFDEGSGKIAKDSSGNGNDGNLNGGELKWVDGKFGKALQFNGKDTFVEVPYKDMFNLNKGFTLAAWVKPAVAPFAVEQWRGIINGQKSTHGPYLLQMSAAQGEIGAWFGGTWVWNLTAILIDAKDFWHLVGTYDENVGFRIYVNGKVDGEQKGPQGVVKDNVKEGVVIGHNYSFANRWFDGIIDEAAIYNRALSANEVVDLYEGRIKGRVTAVQSAGKLATTWSGIKSR